MSLTSLQPFKCSRRVSALSDWMRTPILVTKVGLLATLSFVIWLEIEQPAIAKHRHKIREASGKVYCCVYLLRDADVPWSTFLLYPTAVRADLESLIHEQSRSEREAELQRNIFKDCSDDFRLNIDDIVELSHIYENEDRREPLFRCEDLLVMLLPLTESGVSLQKLKESSDLTTEGMAEEQLAEADTNFDGKSYSEVVAILTNLVHLKDTKSPAVAHFDWSRVVARMKAVRPFVPEMQQGLLDWAMWKTTYDDSKVVPLTPKFRALFTQNVSTPGSPQPAQVLQK